MSLVRIPSTNGWTGLATPFNLTWGARARKMGGLFVEVNRRGMYSFPPGMLEAVDDALIACFGVPSITVDAPRLPYVRIHLLEDIKGHREPAQICGFVLAKGGGRRTEQVPGLNVFLESGDLHVYGSTNDWVCVAEKDAVFQILHFPAAYLDALKTDSRIEILEAPVLAEFDAAIEQAQQTLKMPVLSWMYSAFGRVSQAPLDF